MEKSIIKKENQDINTGLIVPSSSFISNSGFAYIAGIREFEGLTIVEEIAKSSESYLTYLSGVKVFDKNNDLIISKSAGKGCYYERETARKIILKEMINMLGKSNEGNSSFSIDDAYQKLDRMLDKAYYKESYIALNKWFKSVNQ